MTRLRPLGRRFVVVTRAVVRFEEAGRGRTPFARSDSCFFGRLPAVTFGDFGGSPGERCAARRPELRFALPFFAGRLAASGAAAAAAAPGAAGFAFGGLDAGTGAGVGASAGAG